MEKEEELGVVGSLPGSVRSSLDSLTFSDDEPLLQQGHPAKCKYCHHGSMGMLFLVLMEVTLYLIGEPGWEQMHDKVGIKTTERLNQTDYIPLFETHALPMICERGAGNELH